MCMGKLVSGKPGWELQWPHSLCKDTSRVRSVASLLSIACHIGKIKAQVNPALENPCKVRISFLDHAGCLLTWRSRDAISPWGLMRGVNGLQVALLTSSWCAWLGQHSSLQLLSRALAIKASFGACRCHRQLFTGNGAVHGAGIPAVRRRGAQG